MTTAQQFLIASSIVNGLALIVTAYFRIRIAIVQRRFRKLEQ